jgi:hypothetical protein
MSIGSFLASAGRIGEGVEQYQTDSALRQLQRQQAIAAQDALAREAAVRRDLKMLPQLDPLDMPQLGAPMQLEQVPAQPEPMTTGADTGADTGGTTKTKTAGVTPPTGVVFKPFAVDGVSIKPWNTSRPDRLNAGFAGFERVDPNASDVEQYNARYRNDTKLGGILYNLSQSTVVPFQSIRSPFVSQKSKQDLETSQQAANWYQTNDAKDYFRRNPEMLAVAQKNPVNFFDALNKTNQRFSAAQAKVKAAPAGVQEEPAFLAESRNLPAWQQITQGAESGAATQQAATGFLAKVAAAETGGLANPYVSNLEGKSSAFGPFQITRGTWIDTYRKLYPNTGLPGEAIWRRRSDPELQNKVAAELESTNSAQLTAAGVPVNDTTKYLAWFLGSGGAAKLLRSGQNTPVKDVLGKDQIAANPTVLRGKTVGQVVDWAAGKMSGGGATAVAGGATAPVPQLKSSDFYLAKEGAIGSDLALALRNRQEIARIATIYQQNGMVDQFLNLRYKLMETDSNLLYLQGMQAIQEISALRDPRRLESVYSAYLGSPVRFQPRSDGTWNVIANGNVVQAGMETGSLITAVRTGIDKQYLADRTKLSSEISMETFKSQLRRQETAEQKTLEAAASIQKALIEGKVQLAKTIAENAGGKITAQGDNVYLQKDGQLYKIDPGGEQVPGAAAGLMTQPSARLVPVGASG